MRQFTQFSSCAGFVPETAGEPPRYLPACSLETIVAKELLDAVRMAEAEPSLGRETLPRKPEIDTLLMNLNVAAEEALCGRTPWKLAFSGIPPSSISIIRRRVG